MIEAIETVLTILFSAIALLAGIGFVLFRQPVYAALAFAATVLAATGLYMLQDAAYLAAATMVIYAGATIIMFLFVLMFAQHSHLQTYELKFSNLPAALVASLCMVLILCYAIGSRGTTGSQFGQLVSRGIVEDTSSQPTEKKSSNVTDAKDAEEPARLKSGPDRPLDDGHDMSVSALGKVAYTRYLWALELAGTLLLVAAGGAILIAQRDPGVSESTGVSA